MIKKGTLNANDSKFVLLPDLSFVEVHIEVFGLNIKHTHIPHSHIVHMIF